MTRYIAAYDTESQDCLTVCKRIREVHERYGVPATFFVVGKRLEEQAAEYRGLETTTYAGEWQRLSAGPARS